MPVHEEPSDRPGTRLLVGTDDTGAVLWRSWLSDDVDPAIRLNIDAPTATDLDGVEIAYRVPTCDEWDDLSLGTADQHRAVAAYAVVAGASELTDAATAAGVTEQALIDEALAWEAAP